MSKKEKWFLRIFIAIVLIYGIVVVAVVASYGSGDAPPEKKELSVDSLRKIHKRLRPRHDPREDCLVTKDDSIHFYEDGM